MIHERVLLDTGPLVASFVEHEPYHRTCVDLIDQLILPAYTSWPVMTESIYLLRRRRDAVHTLLELADQGSLEVLDLDHDAYRWISEFTRRYDDLNPDLADASLMYLAEREGIDTVFTLDRRDFLVYRRTDGGSLNVIPTAE